mmetsp:Transcript_13666/g.25286  ORF Transcript_13666/g.25286 Transcript_13666/m.25286 type:complete len:509 (-) Transcript_13666:67-1593(-)|eukprot:CAMPEP_0184520304 /NCGR_PEP_ID=MMETSP0198_2-20121128/7092_1 /TAXON_ID=1112570 /ORGANISM="Thraustochytrium sp., Strain LLF1b" /LENGTH=508 /DNA_ID=CAMNT_0026910885 /DNA_START=325 /DNA_END=1851 /DNA_ORIENTATION=+
MEGQICADNDHEVPLLQESERQGADEASSEETTSGDMRGGCLNLRPSVWVLIPAMFLFLIGDIMVYTLMPAIQASWFTKCEADGLNIPTGNATSTSSPCLPNYEEAQAMRGLVDSLRNLFSFFSAAIIGRLSDVYGRKPVILLGVVVAKLPIIALFFTNAQSPMAYYGTCLFVGVLGCGVKGYVGTVALAYLSDAAPAKELPVQMGILAATMTVSLVLNPVLGHFTPTLDLHEILFLNLSLVALGLLYVVFVLPESLPVEKRNTFQLSRTMNPLAPLKLLAKSRVMRWVSILFFLGAAAEAGVGEIALNYIDQVLGLSGAESIQFNQYLMASIGLCMFISNTVLLRFLLGLNLSPVTLFIISQIGSAAHIGVYILLGFFPQKFLVFFNGIPTAFLSLMPVACNTLVSTNMGQQEQGFALGTLSAMGGIGDVISPILFSELYAYFGHNFNLPEVPFAIGVLSALAALFLALFGPLRELSSVKQEVPQPSHSAVFTPPSSNIARQADETA